MTLIVSLRTPDGIVLAGDSIASMMTNMNFEADIEVECPECNHKHTVSVNVPMPSMPATTFSYAQKIFPFLKRYGVGTSGTGMILGKSIYYITREFEQSMSASHNLARISGVGDVAEEFGKHFHGMIEKQVKSEGKTLLDINPKAVILEFLVAGYDKGEPKTIEVKIGRDYTITDHTATGACTITGQHHVAAAIWSLYGNPNESPAFDVFSLQDAIAYAEFLINTTAAHQQFSRKMPNVGGDIDIALITPFSAFQWIRQKPLSKLLGD